MKSRKRLGGGKEGGGVAVDIDFRRTRHDRHA